MADSVTERRVKPIEEAVDAGQWKQALKECDKCQKKGEKSDRFLALKALVLAHQTDEKLRERGRVEALQLARREPVPTSQRAIDLLVDALEELSLSAESDKLWQRAISQTANQDLAFSHMWKCIAKENWLEAQKSLASFKKAFPRERQYEFWNVVLCFLVHLDQSVDQKQRALFGTLAYRMLVKLAEAVPDNQQQDQLAPGKSIATAEELCFLVYVYLESGHAAEAVQLLLGPKFDANSTIGKQDPQLRSELLLKALKKAERWDDTFSICSGLLGDGEHAADDRVWELLLAAEANASTPKTAALEALLADHTAETRPHNRSAFVARMKYLKGSRTSDSLLSLCKAYFSQHQAKIFVFTDLLPILSSLDRGDQESFRDFLATQNSDPDGRQRTNEALVIFDRCVESPPSTDLETLVRRAREAAELYHVAHQAGQKATNMVMLAALDLCHGAMVSGEVDYILRAIVLLELGRKQDPDAFHLSVLLIECYVKLGAVSQALGRFAKLSIKNLQMESVAHLILNRISSVHPQEAVSEDLTLDPLEALDAGVDVITRGTGSLEAPIRMGLQNGSYSQIINTVELRRNSRTSIQRWLYALEANRIMRLHGNKGPPEVIAEPPRPLPPSGRGRFADLRDYSFLYRLTEGDDSVHDYLRGGPKTGDSFARVMFFVDNVANFLKFDLSTAAADANSAQTTYGRIRGQAVAPLLREEWKPELTQAEAGLFACALLLRQLIVRHCEHGSLALEGSKAIAEINGLVAAAVRRFKGKAQHHGDDAATSIPAWDFLHESYCWLEVCQTVALFLEWTKQRTQRQKQNPKPKPKQAKDGGKKAAAAAANKGGEQNGQQEDGGVDVNDDELREWIAKEIRPALSSSSSSQDQAVGGSDPSSTKEAISSLWSEIREGALQMIDRLSPEDVVVARLVDAVLAAAPATRDTAGELAWSATLQRLCGDTGSAERELVERVCRSLVKSWVASVEGILQIKVNGI